MTIANKAVEYKLYIEEKDVRTQQTSSSWAEVVGEQELHEERFEIHCQESQTDIESS